MYILALIYIGYYYDDVGSDICSTPTSSEIFMNENQNDIDSHDNDTRASDSVTHSSECDDDSSECDDDARVAFV